MANLKLRSTTSATDPGSTSAKGSALTHSEMDSNFILLNNEKIDSASPTLTGTVQIDNNGTLQFNEATANGSNYVQIKSLASIAANYTLTLPPNDGDSGQVLTTDGSGVLTWTSKTVDTTNLVDDTSPQLGGDLDVNSNKIVSASNGNITVEPNGTGVLKLNNGTTSGNIQLDITTGQTLSPFGGVLSDPTNTVEIKGGRYASGLRVYDASVGDGTVAGFQLDPFHFDKHLGSPQKKGGQFSIQLFGEGLPKESYGGFGETDAVGVHQKFEIKDNSDYFIGSVNTAANDATVTDDDYVSGTVANVSGTNGDDFVSATGSTPFASVETGDFVSIPGAGSGGADLETTVTDKNDDEDELTLADNVETDVSGVTLTFRRAFFENTTAGDFIRIEGAVSDADGNAMSGNLNCTISSVAANKETVELNLDAGPNSDKNTLDNLLTGTGKTAVLIRNSSTAIRMSAGTTDARHTFTHKSEQQGTDLDSNERVTLAFEAKKIIFQAGTDSSNVNAIQAESDQVIINESVNDVDFRVHGSNNDDILKVDAGNEIVSTNGVFQVYSAGSDPSSNLAEGQMYFNSSTKKFMGYNGTSWVVIGSQS